MFESYLNHTFKSLFESSLNNDNFPSETVVIIQLWIKLENGFQSGNNWHCFASRGQKSSFWGSTFKSTLKYGSKQWKLTMKWLAAKIWNQLWNTINMI